jgi:glucose-6-phosphate 1-dehydrogenase
MNKQPGPDAPSIVIFGASGDLTRRKLVPALYRLYAKERLPASFRIAGFARTEMDDDGFRELMRENTAEHSPSFDEETWEMFAQNLYYVVGAYDDEAALHRLEERLAELEPDGAGRLYHLSVPPSVYPTIVASLGRAGMAHNEEGWCRVIVEKPFGEDLESARALNRRLHEVLDEEQIYRIDHYLGKETVQNLLVFRFANAIFEPIWNRNYISHVQITAAEEGDVGHRGSFYDATGILRDMFQNHLLQLLALVAMEPPASFQADALRNEKAKVLSALQQSGERSLAQNSVRGQYEGYRKAEGVAGDSETATFAALRLYLDNWRWQGVPFYCALARRWPVRRRRSSSTSGSRPSSCLAATAGRPAPTTLPSASSPTRASISASPPKFPIRWPIWNPSIWSSITPITSRAKTYPTPTSACSSTP